MTADLAHERSEILIVEDQLLLALDLSNALEKAGFETLGPCANVEMALRTLAETTPDAAILDINLGSGTTSEPVADELERRDVPFAFVSAYSRDIPIMEKFPNALFENKPVNAIELKRLLDDLMRA